MNTRNRIVITGVGELVPAETDERLTKELSMQGACATQDLEEPFQSEIRNPKSEMRSIPGFRIEDYLETPKTYLDRCSAFALAAANIAMKDSGLKNYGFEPQRVGVCLGTAYGCLETMQVFLEKVLDSGAKVANSLLFGHSYVNTPTSLVAMEFNLRGYHSTFCVGDCSGATALAMGMDVLKRGGADALLVGGVDVLSPPLLAVKSVEVTSCDSQKVLSEGAGFLVLEREDHAQRRQASYDNELAGAGMAYGRDQSDTVTRSMRSALEDKCNGARHAELVEAPPKPSALRQAQGDVSLHRMDQVSAFMNTAQRYGDSRYCESQTSFFGATGLLALIAAMRQRNDDNLDSIVNTWDSGGNAVSLLLRKIEPCTMNH